MVSMYGPITDAQQVYVLPVGWSGFNVHVFMDDNDVCLIRIFPTYLEFAGNAEYVATLQVMAHGYQGGPWGLELVVGPEIDKTTCQVGPFDNLAMLQAFKQEVAARTGERHDH